LNSGDQLEINFEKKLALETLIILFNPSLIEEALNYHNQSADELLSMGNSRSVYTLQIPAIPFTYTESIRQNIAKILNTAFREEMESENSYFDLVEEFLNLSNTSRDDLSKLNVKKKSTREELYRRIFLARIFMQDNLRLPLTVGQIAKEACLNKFHFLKLFKKYYGITPYQHLIDIKMERAHDLLKSGKFSAGEVCLMIGFESQGSFTNLFKKYYGLPPSKFKRSA
jgi:AraC-like DNA-binding protein